MRWIPLLAAALVTAQDEGPLELARAGRGQFLGAPALAVKEGSVVVLWERHRFALPVPVGNVDRWIARRASLDGRSFNAEDVAVKYYQHDAMYPGLAFDSQGKLFLSYGLFKLSVTQHYQDPRINLVRSEDGGRTFGASSAVHRPDPGQAPSAPLIAAGRDWHIAANVIADTTTAVYLRTGKPPVTLEPAVAVRALALTADERPVIAGQELDKKGRPGKRGLLFVGENKPVEFAADLDDRSQIAAAVLGGKVWLFWSSAGKLWLGTPGEKPREVPLGDWSQPTQIAMSATSRLQLYAYAKKKEYHLLRLGEGGAPDVISREPIRLDPSLEERRGLIQVAGGFVAWTDGRVLWFSRARPWY